MDRYPDRPAAEALPGVDPPPFGRLDAVPIHFAEELVRSHPLGSDADVRELAVKSLPLLEVARHHFRDNLPDVLAAIMREAATDRRLAGHLSGLTPRELSCAFAMVERALPVWQADAASETLPIAPDGDPAPAAVSPLPRTQRRPLAVPLHPVD